MKILQLTAFLYAFTTIGSAAEQSTMVPLFDKRISIRDLDLNKDPEENLNFEPQKEKLPIYMKSTLKHEVKKRPYIKGSFIISNEESPLELLTVFVNKSNVKKRDIIIHARFKNEVPALQKLPQKIGQLLIDNVYQVYRSKPDQAYKFLDFFLKNQIISKDNMNFVIKELRKSKILRDFSDVGVYC